MNRVGRHGRPPSGGPVRSYPERTPFFPVHSGLRPSVLYGKNVTVLSGEERTGPPGGGRPVSARDRAREPEGERGADKDEAAKRRNPAGGRKSGGSAATNGSAGVSNGGSSYSVLAGCRATRTTGGPGDRTRVLFPWGCRGKEEHGRS